MKKISILLAIFASAVIIFTGCKKDDRTPVLDIKATVNPAWLVAPTPDTHFQLVKDSADMVLTTLEWSDVVYSLSGLPSPLYSLQLLMADSTVADQVYWGEAIELFTFPETTRTVTYGELNTAIVKIIGTKFAEDTVITAGFRIKANVNANDVSNVIDAFSDIASYTVTPYSTSIEVPPLYLLGAATTIGWDNNNPELQFSYDAVNDVYKIVATLDPADPYYKAIVVLGQWAPQWGTDANATWESGILIYRPTEDVPDPAALPAPPEAGDYLITFDLTNEVYTVELANVPQTMHVIGDATEAGWDNSLAIPMTKVSPGIFELETTLSAEATEGFKFLVNQGAWAPMYGTNADGAFESGVLIYRETESDPDPRSIPPPSSTGTYKIVMNTVGMSYTVTPL